MVEIRKVTLLSEEAFGEMGHAAKHPVVRAVALVAIHNPFARRFVGDLTVRENVRLTAGLHGMSKTEIAGRFDDIIAFAELDDFVETPYKHLSSGMKVRIAFAVISRLEEPIILVDEVLAQDGTFAPAPVGLTLTTRQILDLTLVPSANNYAISYARWVFGSDEAFLAAAHDWLARNGLATVHIQEAAGLSDNNVASTADIVRLARIALSNPLVAEIVSQSQIEIAGLGEITTTNRLLGDPGVVGVKTGTTFPEGYSLVAAKHEIFGERDLIAIAVTMDRPDGDARAGDTRAALAAMATTGQQVQLAEQGARIGTAVTWTGAKVPLLVAADLATVLVPPETASRSIELSQVAIGPKGTKVGEIQATMPTGEQTIEIITGAKIEEPGFGWRFTHPGELLGL